MAITPVVDGRAVLLNTVTERDWRQQVLTWAEREGWLRYFTFDSRHSIAGFPDVVLCRPPRLLFCELKTQRGRVTLAQTAWIQALRAVPGIEVHVWRPGDEVAVKHTLSAAPNPHLQGATP